MRFTVVYFVEIVYNKPVQTSFEEWKRCFRLIITTFIKERF